MPETEMCAVGLGYIGCCVISVFALRGAYVIAVDPRSESRTNALKYGAREVYMVKEKEEKLAGYEVVREWGSRMNFLILPLA